MNDVIEENTRLYAENLSQLWHIIKFGFLENSKIDYRPNYINQIALIWKNEIKILIVDLKKMKILKYSFTLRIKSLWTPGIICNYTPPKLIFFFNKKISMYSPEINSTQISPIILNIVLKITTAIRFSFFNPMYTRVAFMILMKFCLTFGIY